MVKRHRRFQNLSSKRIALERINTLFKLAEKVFLEDQELAQRYVEIARKICMKNKVRLPKKLKYRICNHCFSYLWPGQNCSIRLRNRHVVIKCKKCKEQTRLYY